MKICSKCKKLIKEREFYKNKATKDSLQNNCKCCQKKYAYTYNCENSEYVNRRQSLAQKYRQDKIFEEDYKEERNKLREKYNIKQII